MVQIARSFFNDSGVKTIVPESTFAVFPDVVRLPCVAGQQLHAFGNDIFATVHGQQMDMIACYSIGNHPETIVFFSFEKPVSSGFYVLFKF